MAPLTNEALPDDLHRARAALVMEQVSKVCGIGVIGYRVNDAGQDEVQTETGWKRVHDLLENAGGKS